MQNFEKGIFACISLAFSRILHPHMTDAALLLQNTAALFVFFLISIDLQGFITQIFPKF